MSHFNVFVLSKENPCTLEEADKIVSQALAPYQEKGHIELDKRKWDWWTIGGRFVGTLTGYDPIADPDNYETCIYCNGTGTRTVPVPGYPDWKPREGFCNGCYDSKFPGKALLFKFKTLLCNEVDPVRSNYESV